MDSIKRQASKLREQVAKQQQAVLRQLGHLGNEDVMVDEAEFHCHQQLQNLYNSTRACKHFQRDIVHGVEGFVSASKKQMAIARKLAEACCKYGTENQISHSPLARSALLFGTSHSSIENEWETLLGILHDQVSEPLRTSILGAPLEDARHLTHHYDRVRQEVETQMAEVIRRQSKCKDSSISTESSMKLKHAEARLTKLKSSMVALGREATAAMLSVEAQQQHITFEKLVTMVDAERSWHQNAMTMLEKLHAEMILEKQNEYSSPPLTMQGEKLHAEMILEKQNEYSSPPLTMQGDMHAPLAPHATTSNGSNDREHEDHNNTYFLAKVIHPFDAQADGELSLSVNDYVVVRQVAPNGWSEGECNGQAGWFPSAYVERQNKVHSRKEDS